MPFLISMTNILKFIEHHNSFSGFWSAIIGGLLSVSVTVVAMLLIDIQNKTRWKKDAFQKFKNEKIIELFIKLDEFCKTTRNDQTANQGQSDEINHFINNYEPMFKDFLDQEELKILNDRYLAVNINTTDVGDGLTNQFNESHLSKIEKIKNNLIKKF